MIYFLQGKLLRKEGTIKGIDFKTCQERCKNKQECRWHSSYLKYALCLHWETCGIMNDSTDYVSSQSECSDRHNELDDNKT